MLGCLRGHKATCFPGYEAQLLGAEFCLEPVVCDGNCITSRGAGTAIAFGLALVAALCAPAEAERIRKAIQCV
jgi:4-methyl-5(b-hydroxyethyl)-thiazole monophosphate biosynthesis